MQPKVARAPPLIRLSNFHNLVTLGVLGGKSQHNVLFFIFYFDLTT
jgi:hypothetical protein